jgi:D-erythronate 2-dehydrogenase
VRILVTGAAGFLGQRVIRTLLSSPEWPGATVIAADLAECPIDDPRIEKRTGRVEDVAFASAIVEPGVAVVFHLAAVLSGQSEAEFDVGLRVNVDGTRALLEACRRATQPPRVVFSSTIAALGGRLPPVVPDAQIVEPESTYGATKAICELLVSEYSRRGFVDGISCRVPTVAIRPGKPNSALSSFVSGIVREPLAGIDAICPVPPDTRIWICSPDAATRNLVHAARVDAARLEGRRTVNLPGLTVTPAEMLVSLERLAGREVRERVRLDVDARTARIVRSWPGAFDITRALALGFTADRDIDEVIRQFMNPAHPDHPAHPD